MGPIALVGGAGFLGSRVAAALAATGAELRVLTRQPAHAAHLRVVPRLRVVACAADAGGAPLAAAIAGTSAVVNFVGILNERGRDGAGFRRAHVDLTGRLIEACRQAGTGRYVQVSALNAGHPDATSHYLRSKGEAEALVRASGLAWTILRPSVIFGPGDSFLNRFAGLLRLAPGMLPLAMPDARFAPVHVDDVAAAIATVLARPDTAGQAYDLCGPDQYRLRDLVAMTAAALGLRRAIVGLSPGVSRLQAAVMDFVPGKPFSTDNYRSLLLPSVCAGDGFAALGLPRRSLPAHLATTLGVAGPLTNYDSYRRRARR